MAIRRYLAMTAAEIGNCAALPPNIGWMACHFSPYCTGVSNLPRAMPPGSLLIFDDMTPIHGHDPEYIAAQLTACVEDLSCAACLLDFQRPESQETTAVAKQLVSALPCPVAVSEPYAQDLDCPVFLPPPPPDTPLTDYLQPWQGREIWLEMALGGTILTLTEQGCSRAPLPLGDATGGGFPENHLHCHYSIQSEEDTAQFTLWRTREDLEDLLKEAEALGVTTAVGLYQELEKKPQME